MYAKIYIKYEIYLFLVKYEHSVYVHNTERASNK